MKQGKQISTKQRWMRYSAYMLISAILGGFIGFFGVLIFKFSLPSYLNLDNFLIFFEDYYIFNFRWNRIFWC